MRTPAGRAHRAAEQDQAAQAGEGSGRGGLGSGARGDGDRWNLSPRDRSGRGTRNGGKGLRGRFGVHDGLFPGEAIGDSGGSGADEHGGGERHADHDIAFEEAFGLLGQAMNPFQTVFSHPERGAADVAAEKAEADADAEPPGAGHGVADAIDDLLLLGRAEADVDDVGSGLAQNGDDVLELAGVFLEAAFGAETSGDF